MITNPDGHSPAVLAALDQESMALRAEMETLVLTGRALAARRGTVQAAADLTCLLVANFSSVTVAALCATALVEVSQAAGSTP